MQWQEYEKNPKNTLTEIYTQSSLKITCKMPVNSRDLELPGLVLAMSWADSHGQVLFFIFSDKMAVKMQKRKNNMFIFKNYIC